MVKSNKRLIKVFLSLILLLSSFVQFGQTSIGDLPADDFDYFNQFKRGYFNEVLSSIENIDNPTSTQQVIAYLSAQKLGISRNDELRNWITNNRNHPLQSLARFNYAKQAFHQGDTLQSKKYLSGVKSKEVLSDDLADYAFMTGIILMNDKRYQESQKFLATAKKNGYPNKLQLIYFQSFNSYHLNRNDLALEGFKQARKDANYSVSCNYFIAKILLEQKDYDGVISHAQNELSEEKSKTSAGLYQVLGDAYAKKGDINKADAYFEKAIQKYPGRATSVLYYQAGVSKFKIGNEDKALEYLTKSGIGSGTYSKLSAFQLGRLYIKRSEPEKALAAYMEASSSDNAEIQEESIYQAAKLNASLKRYALAIDYCIDYQDQYADGRWVGEINDLLAQSYLKTSDYDKAISLLEKTGFTNQIQKEVYQKVTFQKSILYFNDAMFDEAELLFNKSLRFPVARNLVNDTYFYLGEISLRRGNYLKAIKAYGSINPKKPKVEYGIAYALYNERKYDEAIEHFSRAISSQHWETKQDSRLRLADCYYATKSYIEAQNIYRRLPQNDYVLFQQAMVFRNINEDEQAVKFLAEIDESSNLYDDAIFYAALISFENEAFELAEIKFSSLISGTDKSGYLPKAYLNRAISRSNQNKLEQAKMDYQYVIENFIQSEEAFSAILGLQDLQQKGVEVGNLDKYIEDYKLANPDSNSLEVVEFEAAKSAYFNLDYTSSIRRIKSFLIEYPQSAYKDEASFYLGDAFYRIDSLEESRQMFDKQRFTRNNFTGRILFKLGSIGLELADYNEAIKDFQMLLDLNLSQKDNQNALNGLMTASYKNEDFLRTTEFADLILNAEWKPLNAVPKAKLLKAKSLLQLNHNAEAITILKELAVGEDIIAAESGYLLALTEFEAEKYDESLDQLFKLTERLGSYTSWIEKAYLLIADNYVAKDELFQAKATLRSIVQHSQNDEIRNMASMKLNSIEQVTEQDTIKEGQ